MKERHMMRGAVMVILRDENRVLLGRRWNTGYRDGEYGFPSGHLESGETLLEGAIREAREEVGVTIEKQDMTFVHVLHRHSSDVGDYVDGYFEVKKWRGEPRNMEPDKCDDVRWFSCDDLPSNMITHDAEVLEALKENRIYSEHGWK